MRGLVALDRALRGLERLADHLPAEHAADAAGLARAAIEIGVDLLDIEQVGELGDQLLGRGCALAGSAISILLLSPASRRGN